MKHIKLLGFAAVAALAAMAFVGVTSALAEHENDTEVVLCKSLLLLCSTLGGTIVPQGYEILAFSETKNPVLLGALTQSCEKSEVHGTITSAGGMGKTLLGEIKSITFTGNCKPCTTVTMTGLPYVAHLKVESPNKYTLETLNILVELKGCTLGVTCNFKAAAVTVDVQDNGGEFALIETLEAPLEFDSGSGGTTFCGKTGKWDANYIVKCEEKQGAGEFACWPSLELLEP